MCRVGVGVVVIGISLPALAVGGAIYGSYRLVKRHRNNS